MANQEKGSNLKALIDSRAEVIGKLVGPIQFLGLVIMVCELSLAIATAFIDESTIRWFLCISMVTVFSSSVAGFFYLIVFHHEKLYPPLLYPDDVVKDIFVKPNIRNVSSPSNSDIIEHVKEFLQTMGKPYPISDLATVVARRFDCSESPVRRVVAQLGDSRVLTIGTNNGITYVNLNMNEIDDTKNESST